MFSSPFAKNSSSSLMSEYASLLGDAVLRHRTRTAEHAARIEAELASRVKSEFISNMSHELRTPLNTIMGFSKLISEQDRRRLPEAEIIEYAALIHDAAGHLLSVINDILDISKMQSGKYTLDAREIALDEVLQSCLASFKLIAAEANVELKSRITVDLPRVRGDAAKLRQIFTNLVSNAIKFTHKGGKVYVDAHRDAEGGAVVKVRDTGIGMTAEEVLIALTPFGQVDASRSRWREGTGLGLPIAKALVSLHGGKIEISSVKNQGTEVTVTLPPKHQVSVVQARDALMGRGTEDTP